MNPLNPNQKRLLGELVGIRHAARGWVMASRTVRNDIARLESKRDAAQAIGSKVLLEAIDDALTLHREQEMEIRFHIIQTGQEFMVLARRVRDELPRKVWLEALSVNRSEWETDLMRQHGDDPGFVVAVLHLENSATRDDSLEVRPLGWCIQMAMMNEMRTNSRFDRAVHEAGNRFFGGAFGEYRERSPLERLGVPAGMTGGGAS